MATGGEGGEREEAVVARVVELARRCGTAAEAGECGGPPPSADDGRGRMPARRRRRMSTWRAELPLLGALRRRSRASPSAGGVAAGYGEAAHAPP
jgi:hypothetical protein